MSTCSWVPITSNSGRRRHSLLDKAEYKSQVNFTGPYTCTGFLLHFKLDVLVMGDCYKVNSLSWAPGNRASGPLPTLVQLLFMISLWGDWGGVVCVALSCVSTFKRSAMKWGVKWVLEFSLWWVPSSASMGGTCFWICCFWSQVAAVTMTAAIMLPDPVVAELLLMALYRIGIMLWRTLRSGLIRIMYSCFFGQIDWFIKPPFSPSMWLLTLGANKQTKVTLAERLMVTDMLVILKATWLAVPKYNGTKASQITQVVYMVNP